MKRRMTRYRYTLFFMNPSNVDKESGTGHAHWFLFKRKRFRRRGNLYPTTHLYVADTRKKAEVRKGTLRKVRFDCFDCPTGVSRKASRRNVRMADVRRSSIGYVDGARPRRTKREYDPYVGRMKRGRK